MKDRENNQHQGVNLPPVWCSSICRNALNEVCVENCAIKRDCSGFEPKPNLTLADMPRFPHTDDMSREEKFTSVTIYLAKVVDHLKGTEDERYFLPIRQPLRTHGIHEKKVIAEVAPALQGLQDATASLETDVKAHQTTEIISNPLPGSENITSKVDE